PGLDRAVWTKGSFSWSWPWYIAAVVAAYGTGYWPHLLASPQPPAGFIALSLLALTTFACVVMLVERSPELLVLPVGLAAWAIGEWHPRPSLAVMMIASCLLCALVFPAQFAGRVRKPLERWLPATFLHRLFAIGGLSLLVIVIIINNGLVAS